MAVQHHNAAEMVDLHRYPIFDLTSPEGAAFADPFGACSINVFVDGGEHGNQTIHRV